MLQRLAEFDDQEAEIELFASVLSGRSVYGLADTRERTSSAVSMAGAARWR